MNFPLPPDDNPYRAPADDNPYRSPADDAPAAQESVFTPGSLANVYHRENLRQFRIYMHLFGGIFIAIASLTFLLGATLSSSAQVNDETFLIILAMFGGLGVVLFSLGLAICYKQMWAAYIAIGLCYLSLFGNLLRCNFCGIILLAGILAIAHTALARARLLQRAGVPLTLKPHQLR